MPGAWPPSPRLGIALGGGAARGLAHLGVLDVLLENDVRPDVVVGTSFGALVGAAVLAAEWDVPRVIAGVHDYLASDAFRRSQLNFFRRKRDIEQTGLLYNLRDLVKRGIYYGFSRTRASFIPAGEFRASIDAVVPDLAIESLPAAFGAVAADIASGEEVLIDRGRLRPAVRASCAIPGVMPPVAIGGGRTCIDGGWVNKVPAEAALALGADLVIAVDVSDDLADTVDMTTGLNVIVRGDAILSHRLKMVQLTRADVVIKCELSHVDWADFPAAPEAISVGRAAATEALPGVLRLVERAGSLPTRLRHRAEGHLRDLGVLHPRRRPRIVRAEARDVPQQEDVEEIDSAESGDAGDSQPT